MEDYCHDSNGLSIVTQLLVGLSKLNFHKSKHNFRETLNSLCVVDNIIDDTQHNLSFCHAYDVYRRVLLNIVNAILLSNGMVHLSNEELLKIILYGHE